MANSSAGWPFKMALICLSVGGKFTLRHQTLSSDFMKKIHFWSPCMDEPGVVAQKNRPVWSWQFDDKLNFVQLQVTAGDGPFLCPWAVSVIQLSAGHSSVFRCGCSFPPLEWSCPPLKRDGSGFRCPTAVLVAIQVLCNNNNWGFSA